MASEAGGRQQSDAEIGQATEPEVFGFEVGDGIKRGDTTISYLLTLHVANLGQGQPRSAMSAHPIQALLAKRNQGQPVVESFWVAVWFGKTVKPNRKPWSYYRFVKQPASKAALRVC